MHGRLAAAKIVVVHRWQVVMHERVAMHALNRTGGRKGARFRHTEERCAFDQQERAQAFSAAGRVPHRFHEPRRTENFTALGLTAQQRCERRFRGGGNRVEAAKKILFGCVAQGARLCLGGVIASSGYR
jgi:hypothetical protein